MLGSDARLRRQRMLMTQAHLADAAGLSLATIKRLERGENVSFETMRAVAAVLGTDAGAPAPDPVPIGSTTDSACVHGTVRPLNAGALRSGMLHAGPSGFVSTSPDPVFLVSTGLFRRRRVTRHDFGRPMRPDRVSHVVAGHEDMRRKHAVAAASLPDADPSPVFEIRPPVASRGTGTFLTMSKAALVCALVCLAPVAGHTAMEVWYSSVRPVGNPFSFSSSASVVEAVSGQIDWEGTYGKDPETDRRRDAFEGPDPFRDRFKETWKRVREQTGGTAR